jgi:hypothetical protein
LGTAIGERLPALLGHKTRTTGLTANTHFKVHRLLLHTNMTTTEVVQGGGDAHKTQRDQAT